MSDPVRIVAFHDFIVRVESLLDPATCAGVLERFQADPAAREGRVFHSEGGDQVNDDKVSRDLPIPSDGAWAETFDGLHVAVSEAVASLVPSFPSLQVHPLASTGYKIQHYPKGEGRFTWHFDALGPLAQGRVLALILYLNDVAEGGETEFHHQGVSVAPRAGHAIFFPTAWTHMHRGKIPLSGPKTVITSFFQFQIEAPTRSAAS